MREDFALNSQIRVSDLQVFVGLRTYGSVRAVARVFGTTPGAVSKSLKRLEGVIGNGMLRRTPREVHFTAQGLALVERIEEFFASLQPTRKSKRGVVTAACPSFFNVLLLETITKIDATVQWRHFELSPSLMASHLNGGLFQLALTPDDRMVSMPWVRTDVGEVRMGLFANPTLAARLGRGSLDERVVASHPFVLPVSRVNDRVVSGEDSCPLTVQQRIVGFEAATVSSALFVAAQQDYLCFAPSIAAKPFVESERLVALQVAGWDVRQTIYLWTHSDQIDAPLQRKLVRELKAAL